MERMTRRAAWRHCLWMAGVLAAALPLPAEEAPDLKPEPADRSRLVDVALPEGAYRLTNPGPLADTTANLAAVAKAGGFTFGETELILWGGDGHSVARNTAVMAALEQSLKAAGYRYEVGGQQKSAEGTLTLFVAGQEGQEHGLIGSWTGTETFLLLVWGKATRQGSDPEPPKAEGTKPPAAEGTKPPAAEGTKPPKAAASPPAKKGALPAGLVGTWSFTTISGTTYWDKNTGAYPGSGTGASQTYTFKDGCYKMFTYIKSRTYGWQIETFTWEEGTYTVEGERIALRPTAGRYQVKDSQVAKNNYTRPMRPEELKKNAKRYFWRLEKDPQSGRPSLMMGTEKDALLRYTHPQSGKPG